ncbi:hypothetical protein ACIQ1J_22080 [Streptomyces sp. NPDC097107]|uniref:effector-associated constant component EACC1 n=1 Tax=Streptomyces sp. NPDC097107 TaxID=3366089 RepID=UPI0037FD12C2
MEGAGHGGVPRSLVTQPGFSAASPALTICAWRRTRPSTPVVTIERNGVRVTGDSDDPADVTRIVRVLSSPTPDSHPSSSTPSDAQPPKPPMHFSSTTADTARDPGTTETRGRADDDGEPISLVLPPLPTQTP